MRIDRRMNILLRSRDMPREQEPKVCDARPIEGVAIRSQRTRCEALSIAATVSAELEWSAGRQAFWSGSGESPFRNGQRLPQVVPTAYDQDPFDVTARVPRNVDLHVRISALDYGGVGFVSDGYLIVR
jgi:hypothetical protein